MDKNALGRWLRNVPLSKKLYFTVVVVTVLIMVELFSLWFAVRNLSAVRSYVTGESHWSKAQKDGVFYLREYATYRNPNDLKRFDERIRVVLGDKKARLELEKSAPNFKIAEEGFREGLNHPDDIPGLIRLFRQFRELYYIDKIVQYWADTDPLIDELLVMRNQLEIAVQGGEDDKSLQAMAKKLNEINAELTLKSNAFNATLGEASRWVEQLVTRILLILTLTVELTGVLITVSVSRAIERGIRKLLKATKEVSSGNYRARVDVESKDEIGQLGEHFNEMTQTIEGQIHALEQANRNILQQKERAEASEQIKQQFLANMSHEIRTPMNGIIGFARLLNESPLNSEQREYLQAIIRSGDNLMVIINDILDFSKLESGKVTFENIPFSLPDLVHNTAKLLENKAEEQGNKLSVNIDPKIPNHLSGDPVRLSQILLNLLSNAVKFTDNGSIELGVQFISQNKRQTQIHFFVKDTGIGISAHQIHHIFESFRQATSDTSRLYGGTGLGLSIVKQLVDGQQGTIWVESTPGVGSTFHFSMPFDRVISQESPDTEPETAHPVAHSHQTDIKILVAEDNRINQLLISKVLSKQGFKVEVVENGKEVITALEREVYDLIIMDLQMPEMDGYETTRYIRSMTSNARYTPIIAMSAHVFSGEWERCSAMGMNEFVSKPFDPEELRTKIIQLIHPVMS
ncbi:MAG TPA: ATP-binding protein [Luteibaculaceae bacterium]|nr:ATP-binding protein [Luteibaculaceae bacterium]